jgi:heptosyltransferase I
LKVLILKPSSLGDVIHALPVARLIRRAHPGALIHWWLQRELVPLLEHDPDIATLIPFDRRRAATPPGWGDLARILADVRRERFDWVLDLQSLARSALFGWVSKGSVTVGLEDFREGAPAFHDISIPRPKEKRHAVDWYLAALAPLGVPIAHDFEWMPVRPAARDVVDALWPSDGRRWVVLQPGARWATKRWPAANFAAVVRALAAADPELGFAVLGGEGDTPLGARIAAGNPRVLDLTGRLTLPGMVEWIRRCAVMITNDTGPMHVAAAMGRPVVALFGPTDPAETGPWGQLDRVLRVPIACAPCQKGVCAFSENMACMNRIHPDAVVRETLDRLAGR